MKKLFVVYDKVAESYTNVITCKNEDLFKRDLVEAVNDDKQNWINVNYKDKEAILIGEYDEQTGSIQPVERKIIVQLVELKVEN